MRTECMARRQAQPAPSLSRSLSSTAPLKSTTSTTTAAASKASTPLPPRASHSYSSTLLHSKHAGVAPRRATGASTAAASSSSPYSPSTLTASLPSSLPPSSVSPSSTAATRSSALTSSLPALHTNDPPAVSPLLSSSPPRSSHSHFHSHSLSLPLHTMEGDSGASTSRFYRSPVADNSLPSPKKMKAAVTSDTCAASSASSASSASAPATPPLAFSSAASRSSMPRVTRARVAYTAVAVVFFFVLFFSALYVPVREWSGLFLVWIEGLGWYGPLVFTLCYGVMTVGCLPILPLTLSSGLLFGLPLGTLFSWIGAVSGGCLAFLLGKYTFYSCARSMADSYPNFVALQRAISHNGWKMVFFLRLSPLIPFNMMSYALSITDLSFSSYATATAMGIFLPTFACVYVGSAASSISEIIHNPSKSSMTLLLGGATMTLISLLIIAKMSARIIQQELRKIRMAESVDV